MWWWRLEQQQLHCNLEESHCGEEEDLTLCEDISERSGFFTRCILSCYLFTLVWRHQSLMQKFCFLPRTVLDCRNLSLSLSLSHLTVAISFKYLQDSESWSVSHSMEKAGRGAGRWQGGSWSMASAVAKLFQQQSSHGDQSAAHSQKFTRCREKTRSLSDFWLCKAQGWCVSIATSSTNLSIKHLSINHLLSTYL
jgi:hypothetical protein